MACDFFTPGQHPAEPVEHIKRMYSPDVKNLVLYLISRPGPSKSIDEVIRMIGTRMLNEFDAMQMWVVAAYRRGSSSYNQLFGCLGG